MAEKLPDLIKGDISQRDDFEEVKGAQGWGDVANRYTDILLGGGLEEFAGLLGLPVDLMAAGMKKLGLDIPDEPFAGGRQLRGLVKRSGLGQDVPAETGFERVLEAAGRFSGGTLPALVSGLGWIQKGGQVARAGLTGLQGIRAAARPMGLPASGKAFTETAKGVAGKVPKYGGALEKGVGKVADVILGKPKYTSSRHLYADIGFGKKKRFKNVGAALGDVIERIRANPSRALTGTILTDLSAGAAGQVSKESFPDSPYAEIGGQLLGGIAGPTALKLGAAATIPYLLPYKAGKMALSKLGYTMKASRIDADLQNLKEYKGTFGSPEFKKSLNEGDLLQKKLLNIDPEATLTVAEKTRNEALLNEQRRITGRYVGDELDAEIKRQAKVLDALQQLPEEYAKSYGPATWLMGNLRSKLLRFRKKKFAKVDAEENRLLSDIEAMKIDDAARIDIGNKVRQTMRESFEATIDNYKKRALNEFGVNEANLARISINMSEYPISAKGMVDQIKRIIRSKYKSDEMYQAAVDQRIVELDMAKRSGGDPVYHLPLIPQLILKKGNTINLRDLKQYREILSREAFGTNNPESRQLINGLKNIIDNIWDDVTLKSGERAKELGMDVVGYRKDYYENVFKLYDRQVPARVRKAIPNHGVGEAYLSPAEEAAESWLGKATQRAYRSEAITFKKINGSKLDEEMETVILDQIATYAGKGTTIDEKLLQKWINRKKDFLDELGIDINKIGDRKGLIPALQKAARKQANERAKIENQYMFAKLRKFLDQGGERRDFIPFLKDTLKSPVSAGRLRTALRGDKIALKAVRRATLDALEYRNSEKFFQNLENPEIVESVNRLFGKGFAQKMLKVRSAFLQMEYMRLPKGEAIPPKMGKKFDWITKYTGMDPKWLSSRIWHMRMRIISPFWVLSDVLQRMSFTKSIRTHDETMRELLYNPDKIDELITLTNANSSVPNQLKALKSLKIGLIQSGQIPRQTEAENEEDRQRVIKNAREIRSIRNSPEIKKREKQIYMDRYEKVYGQYLR